MIRSVSLLAIAACSHPAPPAATPPPLPVAATPASGPIALPGATDAGVALDYLAYDPAHHNVWVPAGGTGRVDVIDALTLKLTAIDGFATKEVERHGQKRVMGPSSAAVGEGVVYVGNRADASVCAIDSAKLVKGTCVTLDSPPDGLQYIAATKELWVTTPRDKSIRILDAAGLATKATIKFEGEPEGFAVDEAHGLFFTNLEDKDRTLVIDIRSHAIAKTWLPNCGEDGPKGLVFDAATSHLVVVCPDHIETLGPDGAVLGSLAVGDGLDSIDYLPARGQIVAAAGRAATLVVAHLAADGSLTALATVATAKGARNAVMSSDGTMFVSNGPAGSILVVPKI